MKVSLKALIFLTNSLDSLGKRYCIFNLVSGGCNGLQYKVEFVDLLPDYTVVEIAKNIFVDEEVLKLLSDCTIKVEELTGYKRIIIDNPQAKTSCSCGNSFSI